MSKDVLLCAAVRLSVFKDGLRRRVMKGLMLAAAANPVLAFAAGDDLAAMGDSIAEGASATQKNWLTVAQFLGVIAVVGGFVAAKTKKDNPQVKVWHIAISIFVGACLIVVPELIKRTQAQAGLTPVDVG
ncbi:DUF6750 family protein [Pseudomonas sp. DC3000-4b1]|uniref:DUF6750 family protein n=1 Tax=unclassified Pseudomonas TaxID=196821 RepID=UPI003CF73715